MFKARHLRLRGPRIGSLNRQDLGVAGVSVFDSRWRTHSFFADKQVSRALAMLCRCPFGCTASSPSNVSRNNWVSGVGLGFVGDTSFVGSLQGPVVT